MYSGIRRASSIRAAHLQIGPKKAGKVDFLEALAVAVAARDIADEEDHRSRILESDVDAGAGVGRSGAARDEGDPGTTRHLPVGVRHIGDAALLPADSEVDLGRVVQRVENGEEAFAWDREDAIAPLDPELIDEDCRCSAARALGHGAPVSRLAAHRQRVMSSSRRATHRTVLLRCCLRD